MSGYPHSSSVIRSGSSSAHSPWASHLMGSTVIRIVTAPRSVAAA